MKKADKIDALKKLKAFVKSEKFGKDREYDGLCIVNAYLWGSQKITFDQNHFIKRIIPPRNWDGQYCWPWGKKAPRIKWINEQLKKLEGKK